MLLCKEILQRIEGIEKLGATPLACDRFDLLCGSGLGGYILSRATLILGDQYIFRMIVAMLALLDMSMDETIQECSTILQAVFDDPAPPWSQSKYKTSTFRRLLRDLVERKTGDPDTRIKRDGVRCHVYVFFKFLMTGRRNRQRSAH